MAFTSSLFPGNKSVTKVTVKIMHHDLYLFAVAEQHISYKGHSEGHAACLRLPAVGWQLKSYTHHTEGHAAWPSALCCCLATENQLNKLQKSLCIKGFASLLLSSNTAV